jgi:predicted Zn-dependent protease
VLEHADEPAVNQAIALCKEVRLDWLDIPGVAIVGNAVGLQPITNPHELTALTLYLHGPWHLVVCLLIKKPSPQTHASFQMCLNQWKNLSNLKLGHLSFDRGIISRSCVGKKCWNKQCFC